MCEIRQISIQGLFVHLFLFLLALDSCTRHVSNSIGTAEDTIGERNELQSLSGPRDTGLLRWLWGDKEDGVGVGGGAGAGGVRQHFLGSAAWQGRPEAKVGRPSRRSQEEDDLQLAISLSLKKSGKRERVGTGEVQDLVEILDDDDGDDVGVEESKASR